MRRLFTVLGFILLGINLAAQCTASFTWDDTDITIQFMDTSDPGPGDQIISWFWDFDDDGNTSTLQNPSYTFSEADKYDVTLTITTQNGCTSSIEIEIETCVLNVQHSIGDCNANGFIPVDITISDPWDVAEEVDIILDGQSVPGSPFIIDANNPINVTVNVPGDGLTHIIQCQSIEIPTCGKTIELTVPDCNSNCFLSGLQIGYPTGTTHTVDVGDDFFSPVSVAVILGDVVNFDWIGDGHSTTSDATTGSDAWNSGVISIGSSFNVSINNPGVHPYYCIPHGGVGGVGMSGEILANCPTGTSLDIVVSFNTSIANSAGYNIYYDGNLVPGSPFSYNGIGSQSQILTIAGDGLLHPLLIEDVNDMTCTLSTDYMTPDCGQGGGNPVCELSLNFGQPSGCDANQNVMLDIEVEVANGGTGFNLSIDGGTPTYYQYAGPTTSLSISLPGDGINHSISIIDDLDTSCSAMSTITTPNCNLPCSITNLTVMEAGATGSTTHTVFVEDYDFNPIDINITSGDLIEWVWTGVVAHTSTSDNDTGADSWSSGLLENGATFTSPSLSDGVHLYYCVPHGNPGGSGMAGSIIVSPPCNSNNEVLVNIEFEVTSNGTSGFEVLVDGIVVGVFDYVPGPIQTASVNAIGDAMNHVIEVRDVDNVTCSASTSIITGDCSGANPTCSVSVESAIAGNCDANNQVPIDLTVTASNQGANFSVSIDGNVEGTYAYTGNTTSVTVNVDGDGNNHTIVVTDDLDTSCNAMSTITTPNCNLPCSITNLTAMEAGATGSTTHTVFVEDYDFNPIDINITSGDLIEWVWTGVVAHTTTSDNDTGADSWSSGLLENGATFTSPSLSDGVHLYYCVPHGNPGSSGMSGSIIVSPPCNDNNEVLVNIEFEVTSNGGSGFEVFVDGIVVGVFDYVPGAIQTASVNVIGDAMNHVIEVRDIENNTCNETTEILTSNCNIGGIECDINLEGNIIGSCDSNDQVPIELLVNSENQNENFLVYVDGILEGSFSYNGNNTIVTFNIDGDGEEHLILVQDDMDDTCRDSISISAPDCMANCSILSIDLSFVENKSHIVLVEDFKFIPDSLNINLGDTVIFDWTGEIAHTVTSDTDEGIDKFNSGLLTQGSTFQLILNAEGDHPYYCVPHGAPGGINMAGNINVSSSCENDMALSNISVESEGTSETGFTMTLDGIVIPESPLAYDFSGPSQGIILVPGDNMEHILQIADINNPTCSDSISFISPFCNVDTCVIEISEISFGSCDGGSVPITIDFSTSVIDGEFNIFLDDNLLNQVPIESSNTGNVQFTTDIAGLGQEVTITVINLISELCLDSIMVDIPDCEVPCIMSNVIIGASANVKIVEVRDFDFFPKDINVLVGDTIRFVWTGDVAHTTTSDLVDGIDAWDSDLQENGFIYDLVLSSEGTHKYYCTPHGGPNNIGMAGSITVQDTCQGDDWITNYCFDVTAGSLLGYNVFIDGIQQNTDPIEYQNLGGKNSGTITLPGTGESFLITFQDVDTDFCAITTNVVSGLCGAGCYIENLQAALGADVIHEIEVRDFDFLPANIEVRAGETIRFIWTGDIPHTTTSDAVTGIDSWDSGLLGNGDTFDITINTPGIHKYYCTPHGGPNKIGQSGEIHVLPQCEDGNQELSISFNANNGSDIGYSIFIDGNLIEESVEYMNPNGFNLIKRLIPADGFAHIVTIQDNANNICAASSIYQSQDCITDCEISELTYDIVKNVDTVKVRDFDYLPIEISVESGDTIVFDWVGDVAHTVTSDMTEGPSQFNSSLLQKGDIWTLILEELGSHLYYCVPHGGPNKMGMAGEILVVDPCDDNEVTVEFNFTTSKLSGTYSVFLNGQQVHSSITYSGIPFNSFLLKLPADGSSISVEVIDDLDSECISEIVIDGIDCEDECFGFEANFNFDINYETLEVDFFDNSSGNVTSWLWEFPDGTTSSEMNPQKTFPAPLVYEVCLTTSDSLGCESTFCDKIRFSDEVCLAGFTYFQDGLDFNFFNTSDFEDPNTTITWTFDNGVDTMNVDTVPIIFELGIYNVCINIESDSCSSTYCEEIDLSDPCLAITPDFEFDVNSTDLSVQFSDLTTGNPDSWLWGFGDTNTSDEQNPTHLYDAPGLYNVCLFVQESEFNCSKTICKSIQVGTTSVVEIQRFKALEIFPNPVLQNDNVLISGFSTNELGHKCDVKVIDVSGKLVKAFTTEIRDRLPIDVLLTPGSYYLQIKTKQNSYRGMFIVQ